MLTSSSSTFTHHLLIDRTLGYATMFLITGMGLILILSEPACYKSCDPACLMKALWLLDSLPVLSDRVRSLFLLRNGVPSQMRGLLRALQQDGMARCSPSKLTPLALIAQKECLNRKLATTRTLTRQLHPEPRATRGMPPMPAAHSATRMVRYLGQRGTRN